MRSQQEEWGRKELVGTFLWLWHEFVKCALLQIQMHKIKSLFKMTQFQALKDNDDANDSVDKYWEQSVAVRPICQCVAPSRWMSGCLHDRKSTVAHSCFMKLPIGSHSSRSRQWRRTGRGTTRKRAKPTRTSPLLVYHVLLW